MHTVTESRPDQRRLQDEIFMEDGDDSNQPPLADTESDLVYAETTGATADSMVIYDSTHSVNTGISDAFASDTPRILVEQPGFPRDLWRENTFLTDYSFSLLACDGADSICLVALPKWPLYPSYLLPDGNQQLELNSLFLTDQSPLPASPSCSHAEGCWDASRRIHPHGSDYDRGNGTSTGEGASAP